MSTTDRETTEPKMKVRDADLRKIAHQYRAGPGTDLYPVLKELQARRDEAREREHQPRRGGRA